MATYAVSDLHGHMDVFEKGLEHIGFSDDDMLYVIGDAIDRGPDGIRILKTVMESHNMHFLLGNHELMMLEVVSSDGSVTQNIDEFQSREALNWLFNNGGDRTYHKYRLLKKIERKKLLKWLNSRPLSTKVEINGTTYILTHSAFDKDNIDVPYKEMNYEKAYYIAWYSPFRSDIYKSIDDYAACSPWMFIIGHVPAYYLGENRGERPLSSYREKNVIDIDGGCAEPDARGAKGGILLRLDDMKEFTLSFAEMESAFEGANVDSYKN